MTLNDDSKCQTILIVWMAGEEVLNEEQKEFYRDQLRSARYAALADAEGFMAVIHTLESIGRQIMSKALSFGLYKGETLSLWRYKDPLSCLAHDSPLAIEVPSKWRAYHTEFLSLYDELKDARNDAVHQGTYARILTDHAVDLTIILEDALMSKCSKVSQFMVRDVVEAKLWQPVSYARQQMLKHSFSYLPIWFENEEKWKMISDYSVAKYLPRCLQPNERRARLVTPIEDAIKESNGNDRLRVLPAKTICPEKKVDDSDILKCVEANPILVVDPKREDELVGILTVPDIL